MYARDGIVACERQRRTRAHDPREEARVRGGGTVQQLPELRAPHTARRNLQLGASAFHAADAFLIVTES